MVIATGNSNAAGSPSAACALDRRAARIAEPEQARRLVERLAGGVVERLAEHLVASRARVTPASSVWPPLAIRQRNGGSSGSGSRKLAATWPCRWSTPTQRLAGRRGERLGRADADQQRADQARAAGDRDRVDVVEPDPGLGERRVDDRVDQLEVVARGDLGHDAAEALVRRGLRGDHVRADPRRRRRPPRRCRRRRSRSRGSDASPARSHGSSHMISASSPLSW